MIERVLDHLDRLVRHTNEIGSVLPLDGRLEGRSNTVGAQFWCVVGARESYLRGIEEGRWAGFRCSLEDVSDQGAVSQSLEKSAVDIGRLRDIEWTTEREELLLDLVEHEAQHQGQLIRFGYATGASFPESWKERWALSD